MISAVRGEISLLMILVHDFFSPKKYKVEKQGNLVML